MNERNVKYLIMAMGGLGICFAGFIIKDWSITIGSGTQATVVTSPFVIAHVVLTIIGLCFSGTAALCQLDRYKKR